MITLNFVTPVLEMDHELIIPETIFSVDAMTASGDFFFLLDKGSGILMKIKKTGEPVSIVEGRGQGPGKFQRPRAVTCNDNRVYVSDFGRISIFDHDLKFIRQNRVTNNPQSLIYHDDLLYLGTHSYPDGLDGVHVHDKDGFFKYSFYKHQLGSELVMPHITFNNDKLYVFDRIGYNVTSMDTNGEDMQTFPVKMSPYYKPYTSAEPYIKKYGYTLAATKRWRQSWSEPSGLYIVDQKFLVVCFSEFEDLSDPVFYIDVYNLSTSEKLINWKKVPSKPLLAYSKYLYFVEDGDPENANNYVNYLRGYLIK